MGLGYCCGATPSSFAKSLGRAGSGGAAVLPPTRKSSYSLTNRATEGVRCMASRDGEGTRNTDSNQRRPACTYHRLAKKWWIYASSFNASFNRGWVVFGFRHTGHPRSAVREASSAIDLD